MKNNDNFIKGTIVGRRSMGRKCAFADVSPEGDDNEASPIKLIFRHQSFLCPLSSVTVDNGISLDEPFPSKDASLPYGAKVIIQVGVCQKVTSKIEEGRIDDVYEVLRWKVIEHPRELAEQLASLEELTVTKEGVDDQNQIEQTYEVGRGAMSCSTYFQARGEAFESIKQHRVEMIGKKKNRSSSIDDQTSAIPNNTTKDIDYSDVHHGGKQAKAKRAKVFASWVLDTFFDIPIMSYTDPSSIDSEDIMSKTMICQTCSTSKESTNDNNKKPLLHNTNVYDIAGGKGQLSVELLVQQMYHLGLYSNNEKKEENDTSPISQCTIIDPLVRRGDTKHRQSKLKKAQSHVNWLQQNRQRKSLHHDSSIGSSSIKHLAMEFNATCFEKHIQPTSSPKLLLGLHSDQCTEEILDVALEHNLSVAIVPCCGKFYSSYHFWQVR